MDTTHYHSINDDLDIVVHVDEVLDEQNRQRVEYTMLNTTGIERAYFDNFRKHLLIIGYDPAQINSSKILKLVKQQKLKAQLIVGM